MADRKTNVDQIMEHILDSITSIPSINVEDIPNIDLYMDQVTTFMEDHLQMTKRYDDDKVLTKTMINNYAKNKLLPPPVKKKYNRQHMLILILIYYLKGFLSLQDIQSLLDPLMNEYFDNTDGLNVTNIYKAQLETNTQEISHIKNDVRRIWDISKNVSSTYTGNDDSQFMQFFTAVSLLSADVLLKKRVIEKMIDAYTTDSRKK